MDVQQVVRLWSGLQCLVACQGDVLVVPLRRMQAAQGDVLVVPLRRMQAAQQGFVSNSAPPPQSPRT